MSPVRLGVALAGLVALGGLVAGCGGSDHGAVTDVTLPSSLGITSTVPGPQGDTAPSSTTSTAAASTGPTGDGAPVIRQLRAEPGAATCVAGVIPVTVTFEVEPQPPVRVFAVFLDGNPAGSSNLADPITIASVACDDVVHTVLLIAAGTDGATSTQAVAFRSPPPA